MLKLVDKPDLGSGAERRMGSIPFARTSFTEDGFPPSVFVYNIKAVTFETVLYQLSDKVQLKLTAGKATPKE